MWDGFVSFLDIAFGNEFFVCLDYGFCDEIGFVVNVVCGDVVSEGCVYEIGEVSPVCFFVVSKGSPFVGSIGLLCNEGVGENR